jgi:signal peptidase II
MNLNHRVINFIIADFIAFISILLDQLSKYSVMQWYEKSASNFHTITPFLNFAEVWNYGVSFGLFKAKSTEGSFLLIGLAGAIMAFVFYLLWNSKSKLETISYGFIIGGAIGNIIDRVRFGAVFDFIDIHAYGIHFWTFNIADAAISIGVVLLLLANILDMRAEKKLATNYTIH